MNEVRERTASTIEIERFVRVGNRHYLTTVAEVPITPSCVRRYKLMQEDCIRLVFDLPQPVEFRAGDRIVDEIFGEFTLVKAPLPSFDPHKGGYHYDMQFDSDIMKTRCYLAMLTIEGEYGERVRKESRWMLTGKLEEHVQEIMNNLSVLNIMMPDNYVIDYATAKEANEAKYIAYEGIDIVSALNKIADEFHTEWWMNDNYVLQFGKCVEGEPIEFREGENVESMTISNSTDTYADVIYVYGGTENIPATYRKKLILECQAVLTKDNVTYWMADKKLTRDMFSVADPLKFTVYPQLRTKTFPSANSNTYWFESEPNVMSVETGGLYKFKGAAIDMESVYGAVRGYSGRISVMAEVLVEQGQERHSLSSVEKAFNVSTTESAPMFDIGIIKIPAFDIDITLKEKVDAAVILRFGVHCYAGYEEKPMLAVATPHKTPLTTTYIDAVSNRDGVSGMIYGVFNGTTYKLMLNPFNVTKYSTEQDEYPFYAIAFRNADGTAAMPPAGFGRGSKVEIKEEDAMLVPSAYYASAYDNPAALARIGELRLQLPQSGDEYLRPQDQSAIELSDVPLPTETVVCFDKIYPDGKLIIEKVDAEQKTDYTKYEGEKLTNDWQWEEYTLKVRLLSGAPFPFKEEYVLPNTKLQMRFITPEDAGTGTTEGYKLAGMTFDVRFNRADGSFTIVRNQDYGALLPSAILNPSVGDACVLVGWNVKGMADLGLIADAEQRLLAKGQEYAAALKAGQHTFECIMMSDFMFDRIPYLRLLTNRSEPVNDSDGKKVYVKNGHSVYVIPTEGNRADVFSDALPETDGARHKLSRIIGYELKLDKPYDSPRYTIGETQAYSRLSQIEREITRISNK